MKKFYRLYGIASCIRCIPLQATLSFLLFTLLLSNVNAQVNAYAKVTAISTSGGRSVLTLTNVNQTYHTFAVNEQVIVIQMQDNVISGTANSTSFGLLSSISNTGLYEVATIYAVTSTSMTLTTTLGNSYTIGSNSSVQVVSFTKLTTGSTLNYTTTANITAVSWSGSLGTGGVIAFQVPGTLTLKNSVIADGQGFAGGAVSADYESTCEPTVYRTNSTNYAAKGEGIYLINTTANANYVRGRARILTGGGGGSDDNGGGAGGSNYSAGGDGGPGWTCTGTDAAGGLGGIALGTYLTTGTRVFMGGGGGGGQGNNGTQTAGANGGGIIFIQAGAITTSCTSTTLRISANGNSSGSTTGTGNDGAGGAGAAGTILLQVGAYSVPSGCPLNIQANGGAGGNVSNTDTHGGGGGGGQGAVLFSGAVPTSNITTVTTPGLGGLNSSASGATRAGSGGGTNNAGVVIGIGTPLPVQLIYFSAENKNSKAVLNWTSTDVSDVTYNIQRSTNGFDFTTIATVKGTGNGSASTNYTFTDMNPASGRNYYRLEITGNLPVRTTWSSVVSVNLADLLNVLVAYPNPAHDHFNIRVSSESNNKTHVVTITDLTGQVIYTATSKPVNNIITVIPNKPLKPGLYMFKVTSDGTEQTGKVMIQ